MDQRGQQADPPETRCLLGITGTGATRYEHAVTATHALRGLWGVTLLSCGHLHPTVSYRHLCPQVMNPRWGEKSLGVPQRRKGSSGGPQGR